MVEWGTLIGVVVGGALALTGGFIDRRSSWRTSDLARRIEWLERFDEEFGLMAQAMSEAFWQGAQGEEVDSNYLMRAGQHTQAARRLAGRVGDLRLLALLEETVTTAGAAVLEASTGTLPDTFDAIIKHPSYLEFDQSFRIVSAYVAVLFQSSRRPSTWFPDRKKSRINFGQPTKEDVGEHGGGEKEMTAT